VRHSDFTTWQPPEEEGDDEPIWGDSRRGPPGPGEARGAPGEARGGSGESRGAAPGDARGGSGESRGAGPGESRGGSGESRGAGPGESRGAGPGDEPGGPGGEAAGDALRGPPVDVVELHVTVGRRDGARASDLVRALEKAGLSKDSVQRVRVRERHAFLSVRKEDEERALAALNGATIGTRIAAAERARERAGAPDAPGEPNGGDEPTN